MNLTSCLVLTTIHCLITRVDICLGNPNNNVTSEDSTTRPENMGTSENEVDDSNNPEEISNTLQPFPVVPVIPDIDTERDLSFRAMLCDETPRSLLPFYRFHLSTRKCYLTGSQGPCGSNMIFVKESFTRAIGKCICDPVIGLHRPLVHHREGNQCYFLYTQGYCENHEWLVPISGENINRDSNSYWAICRENQCRQIQNKTIHLNSTETLNLTSAQTNSTNQNETLSSNIQNSMESVLEMSTSEPYPEPEVDFVIFNGNCVQLGALHSACPENKTLGFRDGFLSCYVEVSASETQIETDREGGHSTQTTLSTGHPARAFGQGENDIIITTADFQLPPPIQQQRKKRAIMLYLFGRGNRARGIKCPEGSAFNIVTRGCQSFSPFPFGFFLQKNRNIG